MNTEASIASATNRLLPEKDCYGTDPQVATLNIITDHQRSYQLAYAHFLYSELGVNPALEQKPNAPPQQVTLHFSMAVVTVFGAALHPIDKAVQKNDLKYVQRGSLDPAKLERRPPGSATIVASVVITFTEEKP